MIVLDRYGYVRDLLYDQVESEDDQEYDEENPSGDSVYYD